MSYPSHPGHPDGRGNAVAITALIVAAVVVVAAIGAVTLLVLDDDETPVKAAPATTTVSAAPSTPPPVATETPSAVATDTTPTEAAGDDGPGDVADLPAGLFCRDLMGDGYSYSAAVDYWRGNGQPNQMDEDRNGIPCQTVYSPSDVSSYWGETTIPDSVAGSVDSLPSGLLCRDLLGRGYAYPDAVDYWFLWDLPDRMDADMNGIPCETVYPSSDVDTYWYG